VAIQRLPNQAAAAPIRVLGCSQESQGGRGPGRRRHRPDRFEAGEAKASAVKILPRQALKRSRPNISQSIALLAQRDAPEAVDSTLKSYAFPVSGKMNVADIDAPDVLRVLKPIWRTKSETASRVRQRIEKILVPAKAAKLRSGDNPAQWDNHLEHSLPKLSAVRKVRHMPAMPYAELPSFVRNLAKRDGIAARALEMLILTSTRTGSLIA